MEGFLEFYRRAVIEHLSSEREPLYVGYHDADMLDRSPWIPIDCTFDLRDPKLIVLRLWSAHFNRFPKFPSLYAGVNGYGVVAKEGMAQECRWFTTGSENNQAFSIEVTLLTTRWQPFSGSVPTTGPMQT